MKHKIIPELFRKLTAQKAFRHLLVICIALAMISTGCGRQSPQANMSAEAVTQDNEPVSEATSNDIESIEAPPNIDKDGVYTSKDDVALYLHTYGRLPSNFITKKEAKKLGWEGGSLEEYAPGMCIGGDYFGNYEGLLPEDKEYHECDIDTLGKSKRGAKRIIYSDDGYIYYTGDHYESFEVLYEP